VIYYGSEVGFMRGKAEHEGNRNYFGQAQISQAPANSIYQNLQRIANVRRQSVALQKGLQLDVLLNKDRAVFYRIYQHDGVNQSALVLLNKSNKPQRFSIDQLIEPGIWHSAINNTSTTISESKARLKIRVPAHGVEVLLLDNALQNPTLIQKLDALMAAKQRRKTDE
jgi:cyclomaltodextrin glucanotransferase